VEVKTEENCLAHALVIAIAKVENDPNYKAYIQGRKIRNVVQTLLDETCIDLTSGGRIPELTRFQEHFRQYKIVVYHGLSCDDIIFEGQVDSSKRLNLLCDDVECYYHVIVNLAAAMAKKYVCKGCTKACRNDVTHVCDQTCPPCAYAEVRIPCDDCHRHFRNPTCFANHKQRPRLRSRCANVSGVARSVEGKRRRPQNTNVTSASVATVRRTKISDTCVT